MLSLRKNPWFGIAAFTALVITCLYTCQNLSAETIGQQIDEAHAEIQSRQDAQEWEIAELRAGLDEAKASNTKTNERITELHNSTEPPPVVVPPDPGPDPDPSTAIFGMNLGVNKSWGLDKKSLFLADGSLNPEYIEKIKPFAHTLRFMKWNNVSNDMTQYDVLTDAWRAELDWQIELCNRAGANFWLNTPYYSSETFAQQAVDYIRSRLDQNRTLLVEWANEPWNSGEGVSKEIVRVLPLVPDGNGGMRKQHLGDPGYFDEWAARVRKTFAGAKVADPDCILVLGTQTSNNWVTGKMHNRLKDTNYEAVGITFYFNHSNSRSNGQPPNNISLDDLFDRGFDRLMNVEVPVLEKALAWCRDNNKMAVGYEGGQHWHDLVPHSTQFNETLRQAQSDPRLMAYQRVILKAWEEGGGSEYRLYFQFQSHWNAWGFWGLWFDFDSLEESPKYKALLEYEPQASFWLSQPLRAAA